MLSLSNKTNYAVSVMLELAVSANIIPVPSKQLSTTCNVSIKFLEQILSELRQSGLVISYRGAHGGYQLAKKTTQVTVLDIVTIMDGPLALSDQRSRCMILEDFWKKVESTVEDALSLTLAELVLQKKKK